MRSLVDLLSNDGAYVRIFAERDGYSYELSTYHACPAADLFERMSGYASLAAACEAARFQLLSTPPRRVLRRRSSRQLSPRSGSQASQSALFVAV